MRRTLFALALISVAIATQASAPSISIGSLHDQLPSDTSRLLKRVRNVGDATAYVRVEVSRLVFDAQGKSLEEPVDNAKLARSDSVANGIIASPNRLIIPANGGQHATTLVHRGEREQERYYRIRFVPVLPSTEEFSLSDAQQSDYAKSISASVSVFAGYGSILIVPPSQSRFATRLEGNVIHNDGNATIVLENLRLCEAEASSACSMGIKVHIRPGQSYTVQRAATHTAHFQVIEGPQRRELALTD